MNEKNNYWYQLKDGFIDFLREKGYRKSSFTHYRGQIDFLIRYANALGYTEYSPEIGQAFLESEARLREWNPKALSFKATVIRRLDEYINGRNYTFARLRIFYQCPEGFESVLEAFLQTLRDGGYKEITIRQYHTQLVKMLRCFSENGITSWEAVNADCVQQAFGKSANRAIFATYARKFFAYLVEQGITAANYSGILPTVRCPQRVPSVYTYEEVEKLLSCVDRNTPMGKRDYAVLLLAVRLGMRASDIRLPCFPNVDFKNRKISYVQFKTGVPQTLSLLPEVEEAVRDYVENGRPETDEPYIFLTYRKTQLSRSAVSLIADKYFKQAGIDLGDRHHGSHSLRMTFASELVAEDVPFEAVSRLLGHEDNVSISHYVALATESLRYITHIRVFSRYLTALEIPAFEPEYMREHSDFIPYTFTDDEFLAIIHAADEFLGNQRESTKSSRAFPMLLRILYGCGLRLGEALALRWENADPGTGILHIRKAKNDKERDVPMDPSLTSLLEIYKKRRLSENPDSVYVFESDRVPGTPYLGWTFRNWFLSVMEQAGISNGRQEKYGRGISPHTLRHYFTYKSFLQAESKGRTLEQFVPYLSAYLGHRSLLETERYLATDYTLYKDSQERMEQSIGDIFPEVDFE